jgi:hypothetical protein
MVMGDRGILIQSLRISSLQIRNTSTPIEDTSYDRTPPDPPIKLIHEYR